MTQAREPADFFCSIHVGADGAAPAPPPAPTLADTEIARLLQSLVDGQRELVLLSRHQLEINQRMEERFEKQMQAQRDEFTRWVDDMPGLAARGKQASEAIRNLLGQLIDDLVDYVQSNRHNLQDSEFVRAEMVDRYGQLLSHLSAIYGLLKRLAAADETPS